MVLSRLDVPEKDNSRGVRQEWVGREHPLKSKTKGYGNGNGNGDSDRGGVIRKGDVLVRVSIPAQNIMTKEQVGEERVYSAYTGTQAGQEAGAKGLGGCYLLACFPCLAQLAFL